MGVEKQVLSTPPPQAVAGDPLTPHSLRILRANNRAHLARIAPLEKELPSVKAALALEKATGESRKRLKYPEGQLFDPLYQEEHAEELGIRKAKEEEARGKRRLTAPVESDAAHACTLGPSGTS
ncbi:hypothetical protein I309_05210 [Cryptococcus deuterogattii LA55]|nr:hypothetical protein I309_05210 [Cryptococcus deuterogattii LA55]KIR91876.1 hypothetical protein I304_04038 [Cryptococcus deuterogattii CBS 10090]